MLIPAGKFIDLRHFGFSDFAGENPAHTPATGMDMQHDLGRFLAAQPEEMLENPHHEIHWRVVVIQQDHLVHRRRLQRRFLGGDSDVAVLIVLIVGRQGMFLTYGGMG